MKNSLYGFVFLFLLTTMYQILTPSVPEASINRVIPDVSLCTAGRLITIEGTNLPSESLVYIGKHLIHSTETRGSEKI